MSNSGLYLSKFIQGYWRMANWGMSKQQYLSFLQAHIEFGVTTVDYAYGLLVSGQWGYFLPTRVDHAGG